MPYVRGLSETITRHAKQLFADTLRVVFSNTNSLRKNLMHVKPETEPLLKNCIYQIKCSCGAVYIGQTKRALLRRIKEHMCEINKVQDVNNKNHNKLARHAQENNHAVDFTTVSVLKFEKGYYRRTAGETMAMECCTDTVVSQPSRKISMMCKNVMLRHAQNYFKEKAVLNCDVPPPQPAPPKRRQPPRQCKIGEESNKTSGVGEPEPDGRYALRPRAPR
jgi:hypothetical protein